MSRVQAERLIAGAYRIPALTSGDGGKSGDGSAAAVSPASSGSKLRTLTRLPSRGLTSLLTSSSEFYLQQSGVQFYVDDLVRQLQDKRPDQPAQFIASYFGAVVKGTNVKGRSFEYIHGCLQNRAAFLSQLQRSYARIDQNTLLSVGDFTEMLWCQCRDLPLQLVRQATCHLSEGDDGQRRASLRTLLAAFSACFFFNEFLNKTYDIYHDMSSSKDGRSTSPRTTSTRSESIALAVAADRVIARLRVVAQQNAFNIPPMAEVEQIAVQSASFKEFCRLFYESPAITGCILNLQLAFQKLAVLHPVSK
ncbi:kinase protein [Phytophthora cinnamomi]|uniref:kinase protein n=1 Tax=Phytophthora cinnamomi TaxID=4785 RepID=UPI003559E4E9|nr:kinase protein [Phytophthora cinnamomi]